MYLAEVERVEAPQEDVTTFARWADFPVSYLSHHGTDCCEIARSWLGAMDFAQLNGNDVLSGPRWIRKRYNWGPSRWPLHWCEALAEDTIDCGAHAALAEEAYRSRGVPSFRVQIVQSYDKDAVTQWRQIWGCKGASDHWLGDGYIYHESNAVLTSHNHIRIWDGSAACWVNPHHVTGYGGVLAVRISKGTEYAAPGVLQWAHHRIEPGSWSELEIS
jgi:hypothetical protein